MKKQTNKKKTLLSSYFLSAKQTNISGAESDDAGDNPEEKRAARDLRCVRKER